MRFVAPLLLLACSAGPKPVDCESNAQCRDVFGLGAVCGTKGYCDVGELHRRCYSTVPEDVWEDPKKYSDYFVMAMLQDVPNNAPQLQAAELAVREINETVEDAPGFWLDGRGVALLNCSYDENPDVDALSETEATTELVNYLGEQLEIPVVLGAGSSQQSTVAYEGRRPPWHGGGLCFCDQSVSHRNRRSRIHRRRSWIVLAHRAAGWLARCRDRARHGPAWRLQHRDHLPVGGLRRRDSTRSHAMSLWRVAAL